MRRARVVTGKYGMSALMISLKEAKKNAEYIPLHMHQENTETQQLKDNNKTSTVMMHGGKINETITLTIPTEKEWRQATSKDHDLGYIKRIFI